MTTARTPHLTPYRRIALIAALLLVVAACGGSDDSESDSSAAGDTVADAPAGGDDDADSASSNDGDQFGAALSDIADAIYATGSAHVEVSGDVDRSDDFGAGGGFTESGMTSLTFNADEQHLLGIAIEDGGKGGGISFTTKDFATGGAFPDQCKLDVDENDASSFEGSFECNDVPAIEDNTRSRTVNIAGTFAVHR